MTTHILVPAPLCQASAWTVVPRVSCDPRALDSFVGYLDTHGGDAQLPS